MVGRDRYTTQASNCNPWSRFASLQAGHDAEIDILPLSELMYQMGQLCPAPPVTSAHQANVMLSSTTVYMYKAEIMCPVSISVGLEQ